MSDVRLFQTDDGGDISVENGQFVMSDGLETAVYLSLFGGCERDSGGDETAHLQWWANFEEPEEPKRYRSETQHLLQSLTATSGNMLRVQQAVERDLAWMLGASLAESIDVSVTIPELNRVQISIEIVIDDREYNYVFTEAWRMVNQ